MIASLSSSKRKTKQNQLPTSNHTQPRLPRCPPPKNRWPSALRAGPLGSSTSPLLHPPPIPSLPNQHFRRPPATHRRRRTQGPRPRPPASPAMAFYTSVAHRARETRRCEARRSRGDGGPLRGRADARTLGFVDLFDLSVVGRGGWRDGSTGCAVAGFRSLAGAAYACLRGDGVLERQGAGGGRRARREAGGGGDSWMMGLAGGRFVDGAHARCWAR